jgi:hypothetical protein
MQALREDIRARARVHGTWFPGNLAPDSQYLNAIHGVAAVVMLDLADSTDAPNVRVFR